MSIASLVLCLWSDTVEYYLHATLMTHNTSLSLSWRRKYTARAGKPFKPDSLKTNAHKNRKKNLVQNSTTAME
jgi:hypothetical protein